MQRDGNGSSEERKSEDSKINVGHEGTGVGECVERVKQSIVRRSLLVVTCLVANFGVHRPVV